MIDKDTVEEVESEEKYPKVYGFTKEELDKHYRAFKSAVEKDQKYFNKYFGNHGQSSADMLYSSFRDVMKNIFRITRTTPPKK